jgi:hypothetical protein
MLALAATPATPAAPATTPVPAPAVAPAIALGTMPAAIAAPTSRTAVRGLIANATVGRPLNPRTPSLFNIFSAMIRPTKGVAHPPTFGR